MSAQPVDVLAVLDGMLPEALDPVLREPTRADFDALREARAAVAELIKADREYDKACRAWLATTAEMSATKRNTLFQRYGAAKSRRAAALARCGVAS